MRLWPLSNNARSKQFLPLLPDGKGGSESMVQRVVRQIRQTGLARNVTIATNSSQRDILINQLGEGIDIVIEPERRDTFPAIALASAYLKYELGVSDDEVVVVMPCDPFTEAGYFSAICRMAGAVAADVAELVLMGIKPTYPSSKFGYIVPGSVPDGTGPVAVERFTEKPDRATAEELLDRGAMWNGGVFAFRLGYVTGKLRAYVDTDEFAQVVSRYGELPKISFDYEVVEKAASVAMVPYDGQWKDLGTWNAFTAEMAFDVRGNAKLGPETSGVQVVNELGVPIFVDGIDNAVVAASPDGILVCGKPQSENIKKYVADLVDRPMFEERRWGTYRVLDIKSYDDGFKSLTRKVYLKAGKFISYQMHFRRDEAWTFVDGEGAVCVEGKVRKVGRGDVILIKNGTRHSVKALTDLTFIEVQSGDLVSEDDVQRFDFQWQEL